MRKFISLSLALVLAACAQATTQSPHVSSEELAREQALQKQIVQDEAKKTKVTSNVATPEMLKRLQRVAQPVHVAGMTICQELGISNCTFPFAIDNENTDVVNAYTDGKRVVVSPAMMNFADTDDQLATVLAHEYAHAIMGHPQKSTQNAAIGGLLGMAVDSLANSQGMNTGGMFSKLGAQGAVVKYSPGFEKEADYIGMYILKRAGYDVNKAANLWRRMAAVNPDSIYVSTTHPTSAERYLLLEKTAAEINAKQKAGKVLLPEFKPAE